MVGGELFDETSTGHAAFSSRTAQSCARVPTFRTAPITGRVGLFLQQSADLIPDKLTVRGGLRYGHSDSRAPGTPRSASLSRTFRSDTTFNASGVYAATPNLTVTMSVSRGFRAANAFDFGAIGLSGGAGFEISPQRCRRTERAARQHRRRHGGVDRSADRRPRSRAPDGVRGRRALADRARQHVADRIRSRVSRRHRAPHADLPGRHPRPRSLGLHRDPAGRIGRAYVHGEARPIVTRVNVTRSRILGYEVERPTCGSRRPARARVGVDGPRHRARNRSAAPPHAARHGRRDADVAAGRRPLVARGHDARGHQPGSPRATRISATRASAHRARRPRLRRSSTAPRSIADWCAAACCSRPARRWRRCSRA